ARIGIVGGEKDADQHQAQLLSRFRAAHGRFDRAGKVERSRASLRAAAVVRGCQLVAKRFVHGPGRGLLRRGSNRLAAATLRRSKPDRKSTRLNSSHELK